MTTVIHKRMTAVRDRPFVVFLIGARIHRWWKVHQWLPVALSMSRMLRELRQRPDSGFLGCEGAGSIMVQYWESLEHLLAYAKDRNGEHFPAWGAFNRRIGQNGDVGIWHETYVISPGQYECFYNNMPPFGLGRVTGLVPAVGRLHGARERVAAQPAAAE